MINEAASAFPNDQHLTCDRPVSRRRLHVSAHAVIFGGGAAGLWILRKILQQGYSAILLERAKLGAGQTIASQGIIHGGTKYALTNRLTGASEAVADMPRRWRQALAGEPDAIDLRGALVRSEHQYLWSNSAGAGRFAAFLAAKSMRGRAQAVPSDDLPEIWRNASFHGQVYRLDEMVIDTGSVLEHLVGPVRRHTLSYDRLEHVHLMTDPPHEAKSRARDQSGLQHRWQFVIGHRSRSEELEISARWVVCAAGSGNESLTQSFGVESDAPSQRRPLHMVMLRAPRELPELFGHCLGPSPRPRLTITTHDAGAAARADRTSDGSSPARFERIWYIGGEIAETGVDRQREEQIHFARRELAAVLPWAPLDNVEWDTLRVDRAEGRQARGRRPDTPVVSAARHVITVWPTKLAFAPLAADHVCEIVAADATTAGADMEAPANWPRPVVAPLVWQDHENRTWTTEPFN